MRESYAPGNANHYIDYSAQPSESREYQVNLKVTNKYSERFGLNDNAQNSGRHQTSFGQNDAYLARIAYEPAKKEEKQNHEKTGVRSAKSIKIEEGYHYEEHNSNRYSQHND